MRVNTQLQATQCNPEIRLPDEILEIIFSHLSQRESRPAAQVSKQWRLVAKKTILKSNTESFEAWKKWIRKPGIEYSTDDLNDLLKEFLTDGKGFCNIRSYEQFCELITMLNSQNQGPLSLFWDGEDFYSEMKSFDVALMFARTIYALTEIGEQTPELYYEYHESGTGIIITNKEKYHEGIEDEAYFQRTVISDLMFLNWESVYYDDIEYLYMDDFFAHSSCRLPQILSTLDGINEEDNEPFYYIENLRRNYADFLLVPNPENPKHCKIEIVPSVVKDFNHNTHHSHRFPGFNLLTF